MGSATRIRRACATQPRECSTFEKEWKNGSVLRGFSVERERARLGVAVSCTVRAKNICAPTSRSNSDGPRADYFIRPWRRGRKQLSCTQCDREELAVGAEGSGELLNSG
jgi:hypothetical protein